MQVPSRAVRLAAAPGQNALNHYGALPLHAGSPSALTPYTGDATALTPSELESVVQTFRGELSNVNFEFDHSLCGV